MKQIGAAILETTRRLGWSEALGDFVEIEYEGSEAAIEGVRAEYRGNSSEVVTQRMASGKWRATVRLAKEDEGGDETPVFGFRLLGNRVMKSIYNHENFVDIDQEELRLVREAIQNPDPNVGPALTDSAAIDLYAELLNGVESFIVHQPVIVVTQRVSRGYVFGGDASGGFYANVGGILSTERMSGIVGANLKVVLPDFGTQVAGRAYGWLKHFPEYDESGAGKAVLSQEFEYGIWETSLYGNLIS